MTNPTSNYSFQMPTSADLVTDLPADFEVFGQAVDTRLKALQPGTTLGDLAYSSATANTNTRLPIGTNGQVLAVVAGVPAWQNGTTGDIEGVTAGTGISGGGTSGTVTITNSMATAIDAKGDLVAGTGADAFARLGVGANNTVLTADSAEATGLKWATPAAGGGMTLLSTTSMSGSTQINLTSINQTYKDLVVLINQAKNDTTDSEILIILNAVATGVWQNGVFNSTTLTASNDDPIHLTMANNTDRTAAQTHYCLIKNYASSTAFKPIQFSGTATVSGGGRRASFGAGAAGITTAITSLRFQTAGANNFNDGTILLYGVN